MDLDVTDDERAKAAKLVEQGILTMAAVLLNLEQRVAKLEAPPAPPQP